MDLQIVSTLSPTTTEWTFANTSLLNTTDKLDFSDSVWHRYPNMQALFYEFRPTVYYLRRHLPFLWILLGIPGNILSTIIWTKPRLKSSSGHFLAAGAFTDLGNQFLRLFYAINKTAHVAIYDYPVLCQLSSLVFTVCQYQHTTLILAFTAERYIAIAYPFKRTKICTRKRAIKVIMLLVMISFAFSAIQGYFWYCDPEFGCRIRSAVLKGGLTSFWSIWTWISELLFFGIIPITILVLNIKLIAKIKKSKVKQDQSMQYFQSQSNEFQNKPKTAKATTLTLLTLSFYTIVMEVPVTILYCLMVAFPYGNQYITDAAVRTDPVWQRYLDYYTIRLTIENIAASHYAMGFYISLLTAQTFRRETSKLLFRSSRCKKELKDLNITQSIPLDSSVGNILSK